MLRNQKHSPDAGENHVKRYYERTVLPWAIQFVFFYCKETASQFHALGTARYGTCHCFSKSFREETAEQLRRHPGLAVK